MRILLLRNENYYITDHTYRSEISYLVVTIPHR